MVNASLMAQHSGMWSQAMKSTRRAIRQSCQSPKQCLSKAPKKSREQKANRDGCMLKVSKAQNPASRFTAPGAKYALNPADMVVISIESHTQK